MQKGGTKMKKSFKDKIRAFIIITIAVISYFLMEMQHQKINQNHSEKLSKQETLKNWR